jgi:hypothetical protein
MYLFFDLRHVEACAFLHRGNSMFFQPDIGHSFGFKLFFLFKQSRLG